MLAVDLCAGAGGKSLALAADMGGPADGRLIACDTDRGRLSRLPQRANRAGAAVEIRLLNPGREGEALADLAGAADLVLVDAPCSGTGTWRRNPEARWRLSPERLARLTALQAHILALAAPLVRPGGHLVYAVCSLLPEEGGRRSRLSSTTFRLGRRRDGDHRRAGGRGRTAPDAAARRHRRIFRRAPAGAVLNGGRSWRH
jgi:16S rRNA (cytosine967-C5)-methyltransferase